MDVDIINPFLKATIHVLKTMAATDVSPLKPRIKEHSKTLGDVTGIVPMHSNHLKGAMVVSFSESCILNVLSKMFSEPEKEKIDQDVVDAVGELTNMICGGAKAELAKIDHVFNMASPLVITGKGSEISYLNASRTIVIPFTTEHGDFVVEACLEPA